MVVTSTVIDIAVQCFQHGHIINLASTKHFPCQPTGRSVHFRVHNSNIYVKTPMPSHISRLSESGKGAMMRSDDPEIKISNFDEETNPHIESSIFDKDDEYLVSNMGSDGEVDYSQVT